MPSEDWKDDSFCRCGTFVDSVSFTGLWFNFHGRGGRDGERDALECATCSKLYLETMFVLGDSLP